VSRKTAKGPARRRERGLCGGRCLAAAAILGDFGVDLRQPFRSNSFASDFPAMSEKVRKVVDNLEVLFWPGIKLA